MEKPRFFTVPRIIFYVIFFMVLLIVTLLNYQINKKPLEEEVNNFFDEILTPYNYKKVEDSVYDIEYEKGNWELGSNINCSINYNMKSYEIKDCDFDIDEYDDNIFDICDKISPENELRKFKDRLEEIIENKEYENINSDEQDYIRLDNFDENTNTFTSERHDESIMVSKRSNKTGYNILIGF